MAVAIGAAGLRAVVAALVAALSLLLLSSRALAQQLPLPVVESADGITVRAEADMERVARRVLRDAPKVLDAIYADLRGLQRPPRIEIRLVKDSANLSAAAPAGRGAPAWAAGVAYSDQGVVVVATRRGAESINVDQTVAHELAHLSLDAAIGDRAPRWLHEGFAYLHSSDWSFERLRTLTGMAWTGDVIPIRDLERRFPSHEQAAGRAYAQSYDFVAFLADRGRSADTDAADTDANRWAFRSFLAAIAEGQSVDQAARHAFRADIDALFEEWYEDLRQRYMLLPAGMFSLLVWVVAALLLVLGYIRKRRQNRQRLAVWAAQEAAEGGPAEDQPWAESALDAEGDLDLPPSHLRH